VPNCKIIGDRRGQMALLLYGGTITLYLAPIVLKLYMRQIEIV